MSTMDAEVFEAFRSVGVPDDKAILAAQALNRRDPDLDDIKGDVASLKQDMSIVKQDIGTLKQDVAALKIDVGLLKWTSSITVAMLLTLLFKVFHG
jgi:hypothetical protein